MMLTHLRLKRRSSDDDKMTTERSFKFQNNWTNSESQSHLWVETNSDRSVSVIINRILGRGQEFIAMSSLKNESSLGTLDMMPFTVCYM